MKKIILLILFVVVLLVVSILIKQKDSKTITGQNFSIQIPNSWTYKIETDFPNSPYETKGWVFHSSTSEAAVYVLPGGQFDFYPPQKQCASQDDVILNLSINNQKYIDTSILGICSGSYSLKKELLPQEWQKGDTVKIRYYKDYEREVVQKILLSIKIK